MAAARTWLLATFALAMLGGTATRAWAQAFPDRPLKLVIGFAPGSSADVSARIVAEEMGRSLKQPVVERCVLAHRAISPPMP